MKVIRAEKAGACYGVQRALDIAKDTLRDVGEASTLGSLIHNPKVVSELEVAGMHTCDDIEDISTDTVIIRSHGVTPEAKRKLTQRCSCVIDATCPHVVRAQKAAEALADMGLAVIVVGEVGHPEVEALRAYAQEKGVDVNVVLSPSDIPEDIGDEVGIVVQTTQTKETLFEITDALESMNVAYTLKDTICSATRKRQSAAADLADDVDAMVVIGGRNSSNTTRLAEICASKCPRSIHIETIDDIPDNFFEGVTTIGVSAGASTPENQIEEVIEHLESI